MNAFELISHRRSVRTFDGAPVKQDQLDALMACASAATNPYGLPIKWHLLSASRDGLSTPVIAGTDTFIAGTMARAPHAEEAFGYTFERIVIKAESMGLGTTWIAGTMDRAAFERAVSLGEGEVMPCVSPLGYPAKKMSLRESLMRKGIRADSRQPFDALFFDGAFDKPLRPEDAGDKREALEMVRLGPSAVNRQPWRVVISGQDAHFYEHRSKGYVSADGWDIQKIDMGIALCHFMCGLEARGQSASLRLDDPGLKAPDNTFYIATWHIA